MISSKVHNSGKAALIAALLFNALAGCSSSDTTGGIVTPQPEASTQDTSTQDNSTQDSPSQDAPLSEAGKESGADTSMPDTAVEDTGSDVVSGDAQKACEDWAKALCQRAKSCNEFWFTKDWGDEATCQERHLLGCAAGFSANGTTWTPAGLTACTTALATVECHDLVVRKFPSACLPSPGTLQDGTACADDRQCATGHCQIAANSACGTCKALAEAAGACQDDDDCKAGAYCKNDKCEVYKLENEACDNNCVPWLECVSDKCTKGTPAGTDCDSINLGNTCARWDGVVCDDLTTKKCVSLAFGSAGDNCSPFDVWCKASGFCRTVAGINGVCEAAPKEGEVCDPSGTACFEPAHCVSGTCKAPDPASCK